MLLEEDDEFQGWKIGQGCYTPTLIHTLLSLYLPRHNCEVLVYTVIGEIEWNAISLKTGNELTSREG